LTLRLEPYAYYNVRVESKPQPSRSITRTETIGFVVIVLAIVAVILARWGNVIPWSAR
jgi:hypothetical protein